MWIPSRAIALMQADGLAGTKHYIRRLMSATRQERALPGQDFL
jgi:hypothetical protein